MDCSTHKPKILETFENVRRLSFEEKKEAVWDEERINTFLDKILEFKTLLTNKVNKINALIEDIEALTWYNDLDSDSLMRINDLISSIKDLRSSLVRQYVSLNGLRLKGIAKEEIKNFKSSIDDLREIAQDLESRFFFLPSIPDFEETTKELSLV